MSSASIVLGKSRHRCINLPAAIEGQRPENKPAQGNALGWRPALSQTLKGRYNTRGTANHFLPPFQGFHHWCSKTQGVALGWLGLCLRPTRAASRTNKPPLLRQSARSVAGIFALVLAGFVHAADPAPVTGDVESVEHVGQLIRECTLPGETRRDDVVPRHANSIQLSASRWLVIYSTHGYRGVDDEHSIVYQVRRDAPDGAVLKEGFLSQGRADWFPPDFDKSLLKPDETVYKQHGHMVAFGVPKGTMFDGRPAPHANLFVAKWRTSGRLLNRKTDYLEHRTAGPNDGRIGQGVEWMQFRLNDREDDIEILQPVALLRQKGFETGARFCTGPVEWMNQSFCPAVPASRDCTEWADANHFNGDRIAALKYRFNPQTQRYEWIEMGPLTGDGKKKYHEASLVHLSDGWLLAGRSDGGILWSKSADPFKSWSPLQFITDPPINAPITVFRCADNIVRLFSGDPKASPTHNGRDPLYSWDIAPDNFAASNRRELFSSAIGKLNIRRESQAKLDFCELFPLHGRTQLVVWGVSTRAMNHPYNGRPSIPLQNAEEKKACGLYYSRITYRTARPPLWQFAK